MLNFCLCWERQVQGSALIPTFGAVCHVPREIRMRGMGVCSPLETGKDLGVGAQGARVAEVQKRVIALSQKGENLVWGQAGKDEREGFFFFFLRGIGRGDFRDAGRHLGGLRALWLEEALSPTCRSAP